MYKWNYLKKTGEKYVNVTITTHKCKNSEKTQEKEYNVIARAHKFKNSGKMRMNKIYDSKRTTHK